MSETDTLAKVGEFALLKVVSIEKVGAFLDWGQPKDLFLPFREQIYALEPNNSVLVYIYIDNTGRTAASMRIEKFLQKETSEYAPEQKVNLLIYDETELGFKAIINSKNSGMLYKNEVFQDLRYGDHVIGYIKKIRDDGKIDLILQPFGNKGSIDLADKILQVLKEQNGFLPLNEKTPPEKIYELFGVSKKKYKMALGGIYKKKLISIDSDGIRLIK